MTLTEKLDVWGLPGFGRGELTLTVHAHGERTVEESYRTDIDMRMGAVRERGEVLSPSQPGGLAVAVKSDAM